MSTKSDEQFSKEEAAERFKAALRGARLVGHKPMEKLTGKKARKQRKPKKKPRAST